MPTVLIVDDEFSMVEALGALLADEGYLVFTALNGRQALERLEEAAAEVVLLDFMMPVMDGPQFLQALRKDPRHRSLPVVLMSAVHEAVARLGRLDIQAFLHKPFDADQLLITLRRLRPE